MWYTRRSCATRNTWKFYAQLAIKEDIQMKSAKKDCYRLIQEVSVKRSPFCRWCGMPSTVGHHIFKRDRLATAFLPEAVWGMCDIHHGYWHAHPAAFRLEAIRIIGYEEYYDLARLSDTTTRNVNFKEIRTKLRELLEGGNG
jgi:hypothetical protein